MRERRWFLGLQRSVDVQELSREIESILSLVDDISRQLLYFKTSLFNGSLEDTLSSLAKHLDNIGRIGITDAYIYAEKARLLLRYVRAYRMRAEQLHTLRRLSDVRDDVASHIADIRAFVNRLKIYFIG
ncbi:hypothetical protein Pyrde_1702 [Pyrodictium delaneyi]|uniref:Uncharacterized protein n=1 Tax=Pyrodictium delaneyi TaxID=1273541 RepID=A0A0N7JDB7_9CREN|nr:hypothetical protein [Pyrodictium delaneyi]ALL01745.1 hypothetical protein Pyrde_1702 [Pyrodictium delaneyi]